jgi:hypothetical protein
VKSTPAVSQEQLMTIVAGQLTQISAQTASVPKTSTATLAPSTTQQPTSMPTLNITMTPPIKSVDFTGHQVYVSYLDNDVMQVSVSVPNGISGEFSATFNEKPYSCFTYTSKNLDRLICQGAFLKPELSYPFKIFLKGSTNPIFERSVTVPVPPA